MILVTGAAGFIGYHVSQRLLGMGLEVHGVDSMNDYYDPLLKEARLRLLSNQAKFTFHRVNVADQAAVASIFASSRPEYVIHLAAQAGVRQTAANPQAYVESNVAGFLNILEGCRTAKVSHLVFASSSSVYGLNEAMPFSTHAAADHPVSLYGATKKAGEMMAHSYSHLYALPATGLRFFTVYGPWGRPDMAYFLFTKAILEGRPIHVYNEGRMKRDFTYVDDVVEGVVRVMTRPAAPNPRWRSGPADSASSTAPFRLYNIGNHTPVDLLRFIEVIEDCLGKKAVKLPMPAQAGDVISTCADVTDLSREVGFEPETPIEVGLRRFIGWYKEYHGI
ncbi:MAG TPA: NAD-dependent epimerase [Opitutaceae bacterium]